MITILISHILTRTEDLPETRRKVTARGTNDLDSVLTADYLTPSTGFGTALAAHYLNPSAGFGTVYTTAPPSHEPPQCCLPIESTIYSLVHLYTLKVLTFCGWNNQGAFPSIWLFLGCWGFPVLKCAAVKRTHFLNRDTFFFFSKTKYILPDLYLCNIFTYCVNTML